MTTLHSPLEIYVTMIRYAVITTLEKLSITTNSSCFQNMYDKVTD